MPGNDDRDWFRKQMSDVTRQRVDVVAPDRQRPDPVPLQTQRDERAVLEDLANDPVDWSEIETGDELLYHQPGVQRRVIRKMRRGAYSVTAELDLHGCTVPDAHRILNDFLLNLNRTRQTCVRIIHGKGLGSPGRRPVLRNKVALWLTRRRDVLGYCSAPAHDGGLGALYVLLRKI